MLWSWGDNSSCQLGQQPTGTQQRPPKTAEPQRVAADGFQANVIAVTAGEKHNLAVDELGGLYVWGRTREGQCGVVQAEPVATPTLMTALAHEHIVHVACGSDVSYAITPSGALYQFGALHAPSVALAHADLAGYGRSLDQLSESDQSMLRNSLAAYLAAGDDDEEDGDNDSAPGEGAAAEEEAIVGTRRVLSPEPTRVQLPDGERARAVAGGFGFAVVCLTGGGAVAVGLNDRFQCGLNDRMTRDVPTRLGVLGRRPLVAVACGQQHACVIDEGGHAFSWGMGAFGQLGHGKRRDEPRPRHIMLLAEAGAAVGVACGQQHSAFLLRPRPPTPPLLDAQIAMYTYGPEVAVAPGGGGVHDAATPDGRPCIFGCGHAEYGQLGTGDVGGTGEAARDFPLPRRIPLPPSLIGDPTSVRCGALHTAVLTTRGEIASFGWGSSGALGHGTFGYELEARPVDALALQKLNAIAVGGRHTVALASTNGGSSALTRDLGALLMNGVDVDIILEAGRLGGARRFLCHRAILACRCPRLLAMAAFASSRFIRPSEEAPNAPPLHWASQARGELPLEEERASLRMPRLRAPILALVLVWLYTDRLETVEPTFLAQVRAAALRLRLPTLARASGAAGRASTMATSAPPRSEAPAVHPAPCTLHPVAWDLPSRLTWLLADGAYASDVRLVATDGHMYASRALLCCRCQYVRTLLHGGFREGSSNSNAAGGDEAAAVDVDLRLYNTSMSELRPLLRYIYTGLVVPVACASNGGDLELLEPALALALLPHAAALLMDDLKRLCEAVLVASTDVDNAETLLGVAEACFAQRLRATCQDVLRGG